MFISNALDIFNVISNLAFLVPAWVAFRKRRIFRHLIPIGILLFSSMYHSCNSFNGTCVFAAYAHRLGDFFFAQWLIVATGLLFIYFPYEYLYIDAWLIGASGIVIGIIQFLTGESFILQVSIAAATFAFILVYWISYASYKKKLTFPPYNWKKIYWGLACFGVACSLFVTELEDYSFYWAIHPPWHVLAAFGYTWLIEARIEDEKISTLPLVDKSIIII